MVPESKTTGVTFPDAGLDCVGVEIDKKYFDEQEERFARYTAQMRVEGI